MELCSIPRQGQGASAPVPRQETEFLDFQLKFRTDIELRFKNKYVIIKKIKEEKRLCSIKKR